MKFMYTVRSIKECVLDLQEKEMTWYVYMACFRWTAAGGVLSHKAPDSQLPFKSNSWNLSDYQEFTVWVFSDLQLILPEGVGSFPISLPWVKQSMAVKHRRQTVVIIGQMVTVSLIQPCPNPCSLSLRPRTWESSALSHPFFLGNSQTSFHNQCLCIQRPLATSQTLIGHWTPCMR